MCVSCALLLWESILFGATKIFAVIVTVACCLLSRHPACARSFSSAYFNVDTNTCICVVSARIGCHCLIAVNGSENGARPENETNKSTNPLSLSTILVRYLHAKRTKLSKRTTDAKRMLLPYECNLCVNHYIMYFVFLLFSQLRSKSTAATRQPFDRSVCLSHGS